MSWAGAVALVLATAIGVGWVVVIVAVTQHPERLTVGGSVVLYTTAGTLLGAVAGWLARSTTKGDR